jgi:hypothetical protein
LRRAPALAQTRLMAALRAVSVRELRITASVLGRVAAAVGSTAEPAPMFFEPASGKRRAAGRKPAPRRGRGKTA